MHSPATQSQPVVSKTMETEETGKTVDTWEISDTEAVETGKLSKIGV